MNGRCWPEAAVPQITVYVCNRCEVAVEHGRLENMQLNEQVRRLQNTVSRRSQLMIQMSAVATHAVIQLPTFSSAYAGFGGNSTLPEGQF